MHFANPFYFTFLLFIPLYLGMIWYRWKHRKKETIWISVFQDLKKARGFSLAPYLIWLQHILIISLIILFTIALARPQGEHEKQKMSKDGIDIIIALDVSESMLAEDLQPNRIEAAKVHIKNFIEGLEHDRAGIIVFSGQAFTQSPLSFDYNILTEYLDQISTDSINQHVRGLNGTAIGDAILAAINRFKKSEDRSKVLVLLTDGDANTGVHPEIAAKAARKEDIKIYTIGIGKEGGAPMPYYDMMGNKQYARDRRGNVVLSTFNEPALKQVAEIGDGRYFRASDDVSFQKIFDDISEMEQKKIEINTVTEYSENFMGWVYGVLGVFFLFILLNLIRPLKS